MASALPTVSPSAPPPAQRIALANIYPFRPGEQVGPQCSASELMLVCCRGGGRIEVPHASWRMAAGQVLCLPWECPVRYVADAAEPFALIGIHWSALAGPPHRRVPAWLAQALAPGDARLRDDVDGQVRVIAERMVLVASEPATPEQQALLAALGAVLRAEWPRLITPHAAESPLGAVAAWMRMTLHRPIARSELAKRAGMAESTFAAAFRAVYGVPPLRYLNDLRLARACQLLASTALSVGEIAQRCGFSDAPWFARAFTRKYKTSATVWRRSRRRL